MRLTYNMWIILHSTLFSISFRCDSIGIWLFGHFFYCSRAPCTPDPSVINSCLTICIPFLITLQRIFQYEIYVVIIIIHFLLLYLFSSYLSCSFRLILRRFIDGKLRRYYFVFASLHNRYFCHRMIQKKKKRYISF